jgi:prepilin-type N-terminal cleavage/methylation domain-containing protein
VTNRNQRGVTLVEVMVVVGIIGVLSALAVPQLRVWREDTRVRSSARSVADAFHVARTEAMRTGNVHVVFIGGDIAFNPLLDGNGNTIIRVLNDGPPGTGDCVVTGTEPVRDYVLETGVSLGVTNGVAPAPSDSGVGAAPVTFTQPRPGNPAAEWVAFGADGVPVGVSNTCGLGRIDSGGSAAYVTNSRVDYAVSLTTVGAVRASAWEDQEGAWQ